MLIRICGLSGPFTIVILTQCTFLWFLHDLDMTPKVVGAAAADGANLEMASPGLTQIKWGQR